MPSISANLTLLAWVSVVENRGSNSNPYLMVPIAIRQPHKASCPQIQTNRAYPAFSFMEANWKPEEPWAMVFKGSVCWRERKQAQGTGSWQCHSTLKHGPIQVYSPQWRPSEIQKQSWGGGEGRMRTVTNLISVGSQSQKRSLELLDHKEGLKSGLVAQACNPS